MSTKCQLDIPVLKNEEAALLTVGREFFLICDGDFTKLKTESLKIVTGTPEDPYLLKLLSVENIEAARAKFKVTSYRTGQHRNASFVLTDGETSLTLDPMDFTVESVMDPQEPAKEPFGTLGPFHLSLPMIYWLMLFILVVLISGSIGIRIWFRVRRKRMLEKMRLQDSAQSPYFQFHHDIRKLLRSETIFTSDNVDEASAVRTVETLNQTYKMYIGREFLIPTLFYSDRQILSDLKRLHPIIYKTQKEKFKKNLAELSRAKKAAQTLLKKDCEQLIKILRDQIESLEDQKRKLESGGRI